MASSNRHWPSMFKSKPCNPHHPWQHDINSSIISTGCHRSPYSSSSGCEERSPEPKPRWNPKPEQIRILEAIFNSGMVNPPRDEIRKIRAQLQEYGQVGDANVFYWFQNRKSRSKHKLRNLQNSKNHNNNQTTTQPQSQQNPPCLVTQITTPPSSSSSSSDKSPPPNKELLMPTKALSIGFSSDVVPNSPTGSMNNHTYFPTHNDTTLPPEPFFFPVHHNGSTITQGFCFSELSNVVQAQAAHHHHHQPQQNVGPCTSLFLSEMMNRHGVIKKEQEQEKILKIMHHQHPHLSFCVTSSTTPAIHTSTVVPSNITTPTTNVTVPSLITQVQGEPAGTAKSMVFINDVAFEVTVGPFNVREAFGEDAVLVHASGQPVLTNEWGITLQSLQHGAFYYLI